MVRCFIYHIVSCISISMRLDEINIDWWCKSGGAPPVMFCPAVNSSPKPSVNTSSSADENGFSEKKRLKPWIDRIGVKRTLFSCRSIRQLIFFLAWLNRAFCLFLGSREQKRLVVRFCQCVCEPTSVNRHHHNVKILYQRPRTNVSAAFFATWIRVPVAAHHLQCNHHKAHLL